jgi:7,8-didemethyl-8-hydroxy-5-deazariboflavin synthase CofG subunit
MQSSRVLTEIKSAEPVPVYGDNLPLSEPPPLSRLGALGLIRACDKRLPELLARARAARDRFKPGVITYSRKVFIPLTNLCRDYCGYCTFRRDPNQPGAHTMSPDEVLNVARAGQKLGCTEALFSLGDKPELVFPEMRERLRNLGYRSTLHYLEAMCELVLRETTLLPHPNPGLMSAEWITRLARVSPSMGLMLETTNESLLLAGAAHHNAPDKLPLKRLRTIEEAGKQAVPFTTGILIGIGESDEDRVDALLAIRDLRQRYGHIQEVIIQNFRVKPEIPMSGWAEPSRGELLRTIAVARLLMPDVNIQAPPNLSDPDYEELLDAGINDWGGVSPLTPDFINPERPWPHLQQLAARTRAKGFELMQRLPVYPEFLPRLFGTGAPAISGPATGTYRSEEPGSALLRSRLTTIADDHGYARSAA